MIGNGKTARRLANTAPDRAERVLRPMTEWALLGLGTTVGALGIITALVLGWQRFILELPIPMRLVLGVPALCFLSCAMCIAVGLGWGAGS